MDITHLTLVCAAVAVVAFLYSSVGHGGASGYIATLTLSGFAVSAIKPLALVLNCLVACIGAVQFWRAGFFSWRLFWPFALLSVPAAFLGGAMHMRADVFKTLVGTVLLFSAARFFFKQAEPSKVSPPPLPVALGTGAGIGLLSGLTGTGGGIFLTPLLLLRSWARTKQAASVSALFILVNSIAGLAGYLASRQSMPPVAGAMAASAVCGGVFGAHFGSRRFPVRVMQRLLAIVLVLAGFKLIFTK